MAIKERELPASNQWEIKATGSDIPKLAGMLTKTANDAYRKAFHKNEGNWERISDPSGNPTMVPKDKIDEYKKAGYGQTCLNPRMVVPALPWQKDRRPGERYDDYIRRKEDEIDTRAARLALKLERRKSERA